MGEYRAIHAPHLADTEVLHTLLRLVHREWLSPSRAKLALDDLTDLRLVRHAHAPLGERVWALRDRLSAYDATYVALAEALEATLVTGDTRLARGAEALVPILDASA